MLVSVEMMDLLKVYKPSQAENMFREVEISLI